MPLSELPAGLLRQRFLQAGAVPDRERVERRFLRLLMVQDGSTTRLCETVAGRPIDLYVPLQHLTAEVPAVVRQRLPGERFIERRVCLAAHGQVMMDNLSYIALEGLAPAVRAELEAGTTPIGHLLERLWAKRDFDDAGMAPVRERLWNAVGQPDAEATRSYRVITPDGPLMLITETWRRGMLMGLD
ncbi:chorismate--pyruvate lyase family protein [Xylophilus sp. GOD-11R]|uniref:chorismate--pyruvate lyase family protein n=1 Tax=Xylophilus sp. GOD-11R TaxID=3089814 RepID=UPI00298BECF6|nr:chorismate pyruvate-lyase family protein [Xylophilus sp. GOD-11R]WPB56394.1 chorismate pyruvate-lyase family protein [Xylophilus sp. GOD-11R]